MSDMARETTVLTVGVTRVGDRWFVTPDADSPETELVEPIHRDWHSSVVSHPSGSSYVCVAIPTGIGEDDDFGGAG